MPDPRIPHHHLNVAHEIFGRQRMIHAEQRVVGSRDGDKSDVEKPIPEVAGRNAGSHYDIRGSVHYRFLRP